MIDDQATTGRTSSLLIFTQPITNMSKMRTSDTYTLVLTARQQLLLKLTLINLSCSHQQCAQVPKAALCIVRRKRQVGREIFYCHC